MVAINIISNLILLVIMRRVSWRLCGPTSIDLEINVSLELIHYLQDIAFDFPQASLLFGYPQAAGLEAII
jgi:hypothetical protein